MQNAASRLVGISAVTATIASTVICSADSVRAVTFTKWADFQGEISLNFTNINPAFYRGYKKIGLNYAEFDGGSFTYTPIKFTTKAFVFYTLGSDALTQLNQFSKPFKFGELTYRNNLLPDDARSGEGAHFTWNFNITTPQGLLISKVHPKRDNNIFHIKNASKEKPETLIFHPIQRLIFTNDQGVEIPVYFDFLGARVKGSHNKEFIPPSRFQAALYTVDDGSSQTFELYGRLYTECRKIVSNRVTLSARTNNEIQGSEASTDGKKAYMYAEFDPNYNFSVQDAAELCGYDHFNWYQVATSDTDRRNIKMYGANAPNVITDPPAIKTWGTKGQPSDKYPYYYSEEPLLGVSMYTEPKFYDRENFNFRDRPTVNRVDDFFNNYPLGKVTFRTHLVGVNKEHKCLSESFYEFNWSSDFHVITIDNNIKGFGGIKSYQGQSTLPKIGFPDTEKGLQRKSFYAEDIIPDGLDSLGCTFIPRIDIKSSSQSSSLADMGNKIKPLLGLHNIVGTIGTTLLMTLSISIKRRSS